MNRDYSQSSVKSSHSMSKLTPQKILDGDQSTLQNSINDKCLRKLLGINQSTSTILCMLIYVLIIRDLKIYNVTGSTTRFEFQLENEP